MGQDTEYNPRLSQESSVGTDVLSSNLLNESYYGDDGSLLPPSTTLDENYEQDNIKTNDSTYENSSMQIIYSNDNNNSAEDVDLSFVSNNEPEETNQSSSQLLYEQYKVACQQGDLAKVKELIETQIIDYHNDSDPSLNDNITGLHWAAINNRLSIVKYLTSLPGYNVKAVSTDVSKTTALHWAAKYGYTYIIKQLAAKGSDIHLADSQGLNLLHLSTLSSNILTVIYVLLNFPEIDINAQDNDGRTAIMWACYQGDNLTVSTFLNLADGENALSINLKDKTGFNCLHWAIVKGNADVLTVVIKKIGSSIKSYLFEEVEVDGAVKNAHTIANEMNTENALRSALLKNGYDYNGNTLVSQSLMGKFFEITYISKGMKNLLFCLFFIVPFIQLGVFNKLGDIINPLLLMLVVQPLLLGVFSFLYLKIMLPLYLKNPGLTIKAQVNKLLNSTPFLSAILWSTIVWAMYFHITRITYYGYSELDFFYFVRSAVVIYWILPYLLYKLMFVIDPGYVSLDQSKHMIKENIDSLMEKGQFNLRHFDVNTLQPIILRSRFLYRNEKLINKFDHFCIWIYNDVGLNNHKFFIYFLVALLYAVSLMVEGSFAYFEYLEDNYIYDSCFLIGDGDLCSAFNNDSFMLYNVIWMCMQGVWVFFLMLAQLFMISKGLTSNEFEALKSNFSNKHQHSCNNKDFCNEETATAGDNQEELQFLKKDQSEEEIEGLDDNNFSITVKEFKEFETAPRDYYKRSDVYEHDQNYQATKLIAKRQRLFFCKVYSENNKSFIRINKVIRKHKILSTMVKSSGIILLLQFLLRVYYSYNGNVTTFSLYDFGIIQNFKDFFLNSDLKAPIWSRLFNQNLKPSEALLDGKVVDFDHLYDYPEDLNVSRFQVDDDAFLEDQRV